MNNDSHLKKKGIEYHPLLNMYVYEHEGDDGRIVTLKVVTLFTLDIVNSK